MNKVFLSFITILIIGQSYSQYHINLPSFVQNVYDDMYASMSGSRSLKPKLIGNSEPNDVASYIPIFGELKEKVFVLDDQLIEISRSFGRDSCNAIAHILGHEMAHLFLQQSEFINDIGTSYASTNYSKKVKKNLSRELKEKIRDSIFEIQADDNAVFYAHISGYKTTHLGKNLLDSIYDIYNLCNKKLKSYPPLIKRKEIFDKSAKRMETLLVLYDLGVASLVSNQFDLAIQLFEIIINEGFKSKEVYNNLGISYFQKGLSLTNKDSLNYMYPFDIDFRTNLERQREFGSIIEAKETYLSKSGECFNNALVIDEEYIEALTNKGILEFHLKSNKLKITLARLDLLAAETINYKILISLIRYEQGDSLNAVEALEELATKNTCAQINLNKIKSKSDSFLISAKEGSGELVREVVDYHFFVSERKDEAKNNMLEFKSHLRYSKKKIPPKLRILKDESIYTMKWKLKNQMYNLSIIYDRDIIQNISDGFSPQTDENISYLFYNHFVLKYLNSELVNCFLINKKQYF